MYAKDKVGLVVRDRSYLEVLVKDKWLTTKTTVLSEKGYVVCRKEPYSTRIQELVASNEGEAESLLDAVEQKARDILFARAVLDKTLLRIYQTRGYTILNHGHSVFMAKPLENERSFEQVYGKEFFQTQLDHF